MPKIALHNTEGGVVGEVELNAEVFEVPYHEAVLHQVLVALQANARRGTHKTKTRGEVRGGGRKPWRQKGTGMARHGSRRSPIWKGGGTVFGPIPRKYTQQINKKTRRLAMRSALSQRVREESLTALSELQVETGKTRDFVAVLRNLGLADQGTLVVVGQPDVLVQRSASNLPNVTLVSAANLNLVDVVSHPRLVATREALQQIEEVLS